MKSEEKIPWKCSLILCHSKASYKKATGTITITKILQKLQYISQAYSLGQAFQIAHSGAK